MMQLNKEQIKQSFHNEMVLIYKRITKELKYKSPRLIDLINKNGGYEAAIKYLVTESSVQDFAVLWENERLDLSVEALIINEKYRDIFDESIVEMCDKKLKEYSYAPLKVEEPEEEELVFYDDIKSKEIIERVNKEIAQEAKKLYQYCDYDIAVTTDMWKDVVVNSQLVSAKNLDLLLRIYLIGDDVTSEELCKEEGYTATYPYKDVVSAMAKRIKAYLKVDVPMDKNNKPIWWHLIFVGGLKDNKCFEWSLRSNLRTAIKELIDEDKISTSTIEVCTHKNVIPRQETVLKVDDGADKSNDNSEQVGDSKVGESESDLSDFDKLFESIMGISAPEKKQVKDDDESKIQTKNKSEEIKEEIKEQEKEQIKEDVKKEKEEKEGTKEDIKEATKSNTINVDSYSSENVTNNNDEARDSEIKEEEVTSTLSNKERIKKECIEYYGAICDICGFDYGYTYGEQYESEIEVHNVNGYNNDEDEILEDSDPVKDLIPICRNCHHIIHNSKNPVSVDRLREMIKG